jgi:hypothetical protein
MVQTSEPGLAVDVTVEVTVGLADPPVAPLEGETEGDPDEQAARPGTTRATTAAVAQRRNAFGTMEAESRPRGHGCQPRIRGRPAPPPPPESAGSG